jgi:hypothetical protein
VEVEIDLDDFTDEDIREEYEYRNLGTDMGVDERKDLLEEIYYLKAKGQDYDAKLQEYIYDVLGRIG